MIKAAPVSEINKYKNPDEQFIFGVDGNFQQLFFYDAFYSFLPYAFFNYLPYNIYEISVNCVFAVTDKRIIVFEKDPEGNIDERHIYSYNFNEVNIEFKKKLGKRFFIIEKVKRNYFSFEYNTFTIEINSSNINLAENIYAFLADHNIL